MKQDTSRNGRSQKTQRKSLKKAGAAKYAPGFENKNPSFTKKGPGRYHAQGGGK